MIIYLKNLIYIKNSEKLLISKKIIIIIIKDTIKIPIIL
jgi:hypothetical protein